MKLVKLATPPTIQTLSGTAPAPGFVSLGGGYYEAEERAVLPEGAELVAEGKARYDALPLTHRDHILRARVYRSKDGTSLRARANTAVGGNLGSKEPVRGNSKPSDNPKDFDVLTKAREYHIKGAADFKILPVSQILSGDVVAQDLCVPHRWFGESL